MKVARIPSRANAVTCFILTHISQTRYYQGCPPPSKRSHCNAQVRVCIQFAVEEGICTQDRRMGHLVGGVTQRQKMRTRKRVFAREALW